MRLDDCLPQRWEIDPAPHGVIAFPDEIARAHGEHLGNPLALQINAHHALRFRWEVDLDQNDAARLLYRYISPSALILSLAKCAWPAPD